MDTWLITALCAIAYIAIGLISGAIAYTKADTYDEAPAAVLFSLFWPLAVPTWAVFKILIWLFGLALSAVEKVAGHFNDPKNSKKDYYF